MSDRKAGNSVDALTRLASIEAPEFLDRLVLEQGRVLLADSARRAELSAAEPRPRPPAHARAPIAALFARLTPPRLKSS